VDVTACASEDKTGVTIFAVNPLKEPVRLVLDFTDFGPGFSVRGGEVVKDAQDRRQIDIINSFANPQRVVKVKLERESGNVVTIPALSIAAIDCGKE
jgi:hypothetical protein